MNGTDAKIIQGHPFLSLAVAAVTGAIGVVLLNKTVKKGADMVADAMFDNVATFNQN